MGSAASAAKPDNGWQLGPGVSTVQWSHNGYIAVHCRGGSQPISGAIYNAMVASIMQRNILFCITAVKSNALAELMNRASKIHLKNFCL